MGQADPSGSPQVEVARLITPVSSRSNECSKATIKVSQAGSGGTSQWVNNRYGGRSTGTSVVPETADDFGAPHEVGRAGPGPD
jgi:hypothetical protein